MDQDVSDAARLDAVVTVADAKWLSDRLKDAPEAKNQIAFADVIILNKIDLVTPQELDAVEERIRAINPYATLHRTKNCALPIAEVLGRNAFDLDRIIELEPDFLEDGHHHHHDEDMQSVALNIDGEVDPEKFMPWISDLTQREGPNILRCKGIVAFPNEPKRFVFQGVHMILDGDVQQDWKPEREAPLPRRLHRPRPQRERHPRRLSRLRRLRKPVRDDRRLFLRRPPAMTSTAAPSLTESIAPVAAGAHVTAIRWLKSTARLRPRRRRRPAGEGR